MVRRILVLGMTALVALPSVRVQTQSDAKPLAFEAASIKPNRSGDSVQSYRHDPGGRFTATNVSVRMLIQYAYDVLRSDIAETPSWVQSDHYDIAARAGADVPVRDMPRLVQALLRDRFQLAAHWDSREGTRFVLVVSRPGKLRASEPGDCGAGQNCNGLPNTPGHSSGRKLTVADLAASLSFFIQAPVVDQTGLTGRYDVDLDWTPGDLADPSGTSIFTAVQEQLGLKLESTKGPVRVLVIDHVEPPAPD
jgi:uncharacterized protein (TIGR03435 family)